MFNVATQIMLVNWNIYNSISENLIDFYAKKDGEQIVGLCISEIKVKLLFPFFPSVYVFFLLDLKVTI